MTKIATAAETTPAMKKPRRQILRGHLVSQAQAVGSQPSVDIDAGHCLRVLRSGRGLSIRSLAEQSGLNANTLSLIENSKTSPSVSTLQQLASALGRHLPTALWKTREQV